MIYFVLGIIAPYALLLISILLEDGDHGIKRIK